MIIKYLKPLSLNVLSIIILTFILTILNYFDLINNTIIDIFNLIILLLNIFISSYILGKNSKNKGYLGGLKFGIIFILLILIYNLLFIKIFSLKTLIYYILILITSIISSVIGINIKNN